MKNKNKDNHCKECMSNKVNGGTCNGMPLQYPSCGGLKIKK